MATKELNPFANEYHDVQMFYRLEQEKQAKMTESAQGQSVFTKLAKSIKVIRGNAFKSAGDIGISPMGKISMSRLIDQRYSINPDKYEWEFQMNAMAKDYSTLEKK